MSKEGLKTAMLDSTYGEAEDILTYEGKVRCASIGLCNFLSWTIIA